MPLLSRAALHSRGREVLKANTNKSLIGFIHQAIATADWVMDALQNNKGSLL